MDKPGSAHEVDEQEELRAAVGEGAEDRRSLAAEAAAEEGEEVAC
jgi:hypothetical protein